MKGTRSRSCVDIPMPILRLISRIQFAVGLVFCINVILSPFSMIRPNGFLFFVFKWYSSASSNTKFMYSSKPTMQPSILKCIFSKSQTCTRDWFCKYRNIRLMGCTITFCTFWGPLYDILNFVFTKNMRRSFETCLFSLDKNARCRKIWR